MNSIFHITSRSQWQAAQASGRYCHDSLTTEGFIHCSTVDQVVRVANFFFRGHEDLVLLWIEVDRLQADLRYDPIETGEKFPHLYGALNLDAVTQVLDFSAEPDGGFVLPAALLPLSQGLDH